MKKTRRPVSVGLLLNLLFILSVLPAQAGTVDTVSIYSNSMKKEIKAVVIKPGNYKKKGKTFSCCLPVTRLRWLVQQLDHPGAATDELCRCVSNHHCMPGWR